MISVKHSISARLWYFSYRFSMVTRDLKNWFICYGRHIRDCCTSIKPSENNIYLNPKATQYQCSEGTCGKVFTMFDETGSCPYCGDHSSIPLSHTQRAIVYDGDKIVLTHGLMEPIVGEVYIKQK